MRSAIIGFVAGVGFLQMQALLPSWLLLLVLAFSATAMCAVAYRLQSAAWKLALRFLVGSFAGFIWAAGFAQYYLAEELPRELEGKDIVVVGTVESLPSQFERGMRFNFSVERAQDEERRSVKLPSKLALSWYSGFEAGDRDAIETVRPGERWQLTVRLKRPHGNANLHGFDYEAWLLEQRVRATGYVRSDAQSTLKNVRLQSFVPSPKNFIENFRYLLREKISAALRGKEYAAIVVALVVGDQRGIAQSDWQLFNRAGIGHLVSISGS